MTKQKKKGVDLVVLGAQAARGDAGIIGNLFQQIHAKYEPIPKQKHFHYVQNIC